MVLRQERHVPFNKPDNFFVSTADQMVDQFRSLTSVVALVMVVLSSIGLLVGGIGVMNIMLVSVTERTREIGVRKAIGARRSDIVRQFLTEAVVLTSMGGIFGMMFGWAVSRATRLALPLAPHRSAAVGRRPGHRGQRRHRPVLRHLAREQSRAPGPGGSSALRIAQAHLKHFSGVSKCARSVRLRDLRPPPLGPGFGVSVLRR